MFVVGAQLALVKNANPGVVPTTVCMLVRFIIMPGVSLLFVFLTAGRGWYTDDKLVWYAMTSYSYLSIRLTHAIGSCSFSFPPARLRCCSRTSQSSCRLTKDLLLAILPSPYVTAQAVASVVINQVSSSTCCLRSWPSCARWA